MLLLVWVVRRRTRWDVAEASGDDRFGSGDREFERVGESELLRMKKTYLEDADPDWGGTSVNAVDEVLATLATLPTDAERQRFLGYLDDAIATIRKRLSTMDATPSG